jgi:cytochrome c oxidase subunit IV
MEFNDNYPQYELMAHHSEEDGIGIRKKLWRVFWIMLVITIIELVIGINQDPWHLTGTIWIKIIYITFTIVKAAYIVYSFMHLGDENKWLRRVILWPYITFALYLIAMCTITEGAYVNEHRASLDTKLIEQKRETRAKALQHLNGGGEHDGGEHKDGEKGGH